MIQYQDDLDIRFREFQQRNLNIPEWAKAEHMEMIVPEKELWKYGGTSPPRHYRLKMAHVILVTILIVVLVGVLIILCRQ